MHLEDESWSDWAADSPLSSTDPFAGLTAEGDGAPSEQFDHNLMAFLSDFQSALRGDVGAPQATEAESAATRSKGTVGAVPGARHQAAEEYSCWPGDPYMGSEVQVDSGWWMASDGRWYPPELHPDRTAEPPPSQDEPAPVMAAEIAAAASAPDMPGRKARLALGRPRLKRLGHSAAPA